ncbi:MAG: T3SS effector HopA1 family protein [Spirosomataceae bacterium]
MEIETYKKNLLVDIASLLKNISLKKIGENFKVTYFDPAKQEPQTIEIKSKFETQKKISSIIYNQYYNRLQSLSAKTPRIDFLLELRKRYKSDDESSVFRTDWQADGEPDEKGDIIVSKDNYYRKLALAAAYLSNEYPLVKNRQLRVRWFITSHNDDPLKEESFYLVSGKHLPDDYTMVDTLVRFYFHLNPESDKFEETFLNFFQKIIEELNTRYIPFQFKVLYKTDKMIRDDSCVLYISKRHFFCVIDFVKNEIFQRFRTIFHTSIPMFTYPIALGIGFAEQPPFEAKDNLHFLETPSFGEHRSAIIAYAMVEYFAQNHQKNDFNFRDTEGFVNFFETLPPISNGSLKKGNFFLNRKSEGYPYVDSYFKNLEVENQKVEFFENKYLINSIQLVGFKLCSEAIWDSFNRCSWVTFQSENNLAGKKLYNTANINLIDGLAGIVLFLNGLYKVTNNDTFLRYLRGALKCIGLKLKDKLWWRGGRFEHGYYQGELMAFYVVKLIANLEDRPISDYIDLEGRELSSEDVLKKLKSVNNKTSLDIMSGLSGTIIVLLKLFLLDKNEAWLTKAEELGDELVKYSFDLKNNLLLNKNSLKLGLISGASGIAISLLYLDKVRSLRGKKKNLNYQKTIVELLKYEDGERMGSTWKIRPSSEFTILWSRGFRSMALSRMILMSLFPDERKWTDEFNLTRDFCTPPELGSFTINDIFDKSVCAFDIGASEVLFNDNRIQINNYLKEIITALSEDTLKFKTASKLRGFKPGIQEGYAGLGYYLLRLIDSDKYPSILLPTL